MTVGYLHLGMGRGTLAWHQAAWRSETNRQCAPSSAKPDARDTVHVHPSSLAAGDDPSLNRELHV